MGHEIRKYMAKVDGDSKLDGDVEIDETYIGGVRKGKRGRGAANKTILLGMMERDGDVVTHVVEDVKKKTLQPLIEEHVEAGSDVFTDELLSYNGLDKKGYNHQTINHGIGEYVDGDIHVNGIEGYWSILKKSLKSTHVQVSPQHLAKYVKEFEYRYNSRKSPEKMFSELLQGF